MYAPLRSGFPVFGSKHAMISSKAFSARCLNSTKRDLQMALVILSATFLLWRGLRQREACSTISQVGFFGIHWRCGGQFIGIRVISSAFISWKFLPAILKSSGAGRDRGKAWHPRRYLPWHRFGHCKVCPLVRNYRMNNPAHPLFLPFRSGNDPSPVYNRILSATIYIFAPVTMSSCGVIFSAVGNGQGGPPARTPSSDQQPTDCVGYGICRC